MIDGRRNRGLGVFSGVTARFVRLDGRVGGVAFEIWQHQHAPANAFLILHSMLARTGRKLRLPRLVVECGQDLLLQVRRALATPARFAGRLHRGKQHRQQDRHDGHHDQQLHERERRSKAARARR